MAEIRSIDLNADVGEGFADDALYPIVTSANIACGGHAGDFETMREAVARALASGVAVGAHPSYPDRARFGRAAVTLPAAALSAEVAAQVDALARCAGAVGAAVSHVKPHGALYHDVSRDPALARVFAEGVLRVLPGVVLVGFANSEALSTWRSMGVAVAAEGFADRGYAPDGLLVPRGAAGSLLGAAEAEAQAVRLARAGRIDTICVHSDSPGAADIARAVRDALARAGMVVAPLARRGAGT